MGVSESGRTQLGRKALLGFLVLGMLFVTGCVGSQEHIVLNDNQATIIKNQGLMNENIQILVDNQKSINENMIKLCGTTK